MSSCYTLLFEHTAGGLAEHAVPIAAEWVRRGHRAVVMAMEGALPAVQSAHDDLPVRFGVIGRDAVDWSGTDAILNVIPGEPGPVFRDIRGRCDIPRVTINHGLTDKQTTFPADYIGNGVGFANVLFACGPAMFKGSWERYIRKWPEIRHSLELVPVGCPKTDVLFDGTFQRDEVLRSMNFDPRRPTVLYAPTYQKEASLEKAGMEIVQALVSLPVNVMVRPHHLSMTTDWMNRLHGLAGGHSNLRIVESSSNPLFVAADVLVGDVSGACFEYILQDKPVVFFDVPAFFEAHGREGVGYWGREAGVIVREAKGLGAAVVSELEHPGHKAKERAWLIGQLVYDCGGATARAVDALVDLIEGRRTYPLWGPRQCLRESALLQAAIRNRLESLANRNQTVALFGAGAHTRWLLDFMRKAGADGRRMPQVACIFDDRADVCTADFGSIPILLPGKGETFFDVVILSTDYHQAVFRKRCEAVFGPDLPVVDLYADFPWHRPGSGSVDIPA